MQSYTDYMPTINKLRFSERNVCGEQNGNAYNTKYAKLPMLVRERNFPLANEAHSDNHTYISHQKLVRN